MPESALASKTKRKNRARMLDETKPGLRLRENPDYKEIMRKVASDRRKASKEVESHGG